MATIYDNETVQFRLNYVLEIKNKEKTISQAARDADVEWKTMKSWVVRYDKEGIKGLLNKPRGNPKSSSREIKDYIVELKRDNRSRSSRKIRDILAENTGIRFHRQTIWRTLKDAGENKRVKKRIKFYRDFERHHPNSLWQTDFMDAIVVEGIGLVYLVLFEDDFSRKIIGGTFVQNRTAYHILALLWKSIETYGIPSQIYSDQGRQFKSHLGKGYTHFERVCKRFGIETIFGTIGYPEGRGKIERLFGFIQDDFIQEYRFTGLEDINHKFHDWIEWYNERHEHSSLNGQPPNSRYKDVVPHIPERDFFELFSEHLVRTVRKNATVSFRGNIYPVDPTYIKEKVDVRAFGHDIKIYIQSHLLGEFDGRINYKEKMLRRTYTRVVKKNGSIKFQNIWYYVGNEFVGQNVEIVIIRDQIRAFLSANRMMIFRVGERDALVVGLDR